MSLTEGQDQDQGPAKKKRVIKSRQSLAEKAKGTTLFPLSRIKRIIKADKELDMMSSEATFLVAVATEYFIKHFMEEGYTKARLERRRIVNYKDMANVVSRSEEFDFLRGELITGDWQGCKHLSYQNRSEGQTDPKTLNLLTEPSPPSFRCRMTDFRRRPTPYGAHRSPRAA